MNTQQAGSDGIATIIPYKNPQALTAYYLAVFSLIPVLGMILGPAALILGLKGLKVAKEHPELKGTAHAWVGIIGGGLVIFGHVAVILLFVVIWASNSR